MTEFSTTKLSSKGQVVIPEDIRDDLGLKEGTQFVVIGSGDTVILKIIVPPPIDDLRGLLAKAKSQAKKAGMKKADVDKSIKKARSRR